ncbi:hypothetical protein BDV29DRAFT_173257 [Aspergillus leporis]|uniref:Uncharacterized protein n=1 Tax=Aspergillus leporis TaxID=41062 RepID=A0A5N5X5L8_9EURO|nr:hypothetical protein BDV29DRAFT_173257 [Aspergillus leporis]
MCYFFYLSIWKVVLLPSGSVFYSFFTSFYFPCLSSLFLPYSHFPFILCCSNHFTEEGEAMGCIWCSPSAHFENFPVSVMPTK